MTDAITFFQGYSYYPISGLNKLSFKEDALIELVVDDYGNGDYVNRKTTIGTFYDFLISSHPIFNKIDDVYNDKSFPELNEATNTVNYRYANDIYISGQTYFDKNPFSHDTTPYLRLFNNQTVQKRQLEKYIHDNTLEVNSIKNSDTIVQFGASGWEKCLSDETNPRLDMNSTVAFSVPNASLKINKSPSNTIPLYHSNAVNFYSNVFATIVGKVKIPDYSEEALKHRTPYYSPEANLWVGIWEGKNIIAISELHNIKDNIAYFSFQLPMSKNISYYIVVPFKPNTTSTSNNTTDNEHDLFKNIPVNSASVFYYSEGVSNNVKPKTYFNPP